ncbi:M24 family metallopeptidase [Neomegalonema perideroedes]|uniref:M24 family metallopeptidase n=1 Tax=Neomegalonema perideroedes TaxID=217219 RepID=UPI00036E25AE|nr:Xaa-Pro peptidase family protein [Neomegalonema perideroedes]
MLPSALSAGRTARLFAAMDREGLDAAAFIPGPNFQFLTGVRFGVMERPTALFVARDGARHAVIPFLEKSRWSMDAPDVETVYWQDADGYDAAFVEVAAKLSARRIGVEGQRMRFFEALALRKAFPKAEVVDGHAALSFMRLHKDAAEIAALSRAIEISESALAATLAQTGAGMTEAEVRRRLVAEMLERGAADLAFEPIILAGAAAADCHGVVSAERKLEKGGALLVDFGAVWGGYNADITRTFFVGSVSQRHRDIYEAVRAANALGHEIAAPGVTMDDYDRRVTEVMRAAGFADLVVHKTGHGLGMEVHEAPQVMIGNLQAMEPGVVFTLEPGLYREGEIGVRIEDDLVVTEEGARSLTSFPRELTVI